VHVCTIIFVVGINVRNKSGTKTADEFFDKPCLLSTLMSIYFSILSY